VNRWNYSGWRGNHTIPNPSGPHSATSTLDWAQPTLRPAATPVLHLGGPPHRFSSSLAPCPGARPCTRCLISPHHRPCACSKAADSTTHSGQRVMRGGGGRGGGGQHLLLPPPPPLSLLPWFSSDALISSWVLGTTGRLLIMGWWHLKLALQEEKKIIVLIRMRVCSFLSNLCIFSIHNMASFRCTFRFLPALAC
jgi:hypothetical protein